MDQQLTEQDVERIVDRIVSKRVSKWADPKFISRETPTANQVWQWSEDENAFVPATLSGTSSGHTIRENGTAQTSRGYLNFVDSAAGAGLITDDSASDETEVNLSLYVLEAQHASASYDAGHHAAVTLGAGSDAALALSGQELTLADVLTPTEHTAIGDASPHHAQSHDHSAAGDGQSLAPAGTVAFSGTQTDTLATTENNYDPGTTAVLLLTAALPLSTITGISGGTAGRILTIHNVGTYSINLSHEAAGSTDINRFDLPFDASVTMPDGESVSIQYDGGASRWRLLHSYHQRLDQSDGQHSISAAQVLAGVASSVSQAGHVELATTAEINTGTDTTRAMPVDQFVASNRNVRYILFRVLDKDTSHAAASTTLLGGDLEIPFTGTLTAVGAFADTAGTTGTGVCDLHLNGTTIMTTNKINLDSAEKSSRTAATQPTLTTTAVTAGDIITGYVDSVHTTPAKGLTFRIEIRMT